MRSKHLEDLSSNMRTEKPISSKMRALLEAEKINARKRIVQRGIVHFRGDKEFMEALFAAADKLKIAPGTLCRQVVWEHLKTIGSTPASTVADKEPYHVNKVLVVKLKLLEHSIRELLSYLTSQNLPNKSKR